MSVLNDLKLQYKTGGIATQLVFWNVLLFIIPEVIFSLLKLFNLQIDYLSYVSISSQVQDLLWKPWSVLSYAFFHARFMHMLFNVIMLYFVSRLFLTFFTQKQLFGLYVLGALFATLFYILSYQFFPALQNNSAQMVGSSASIMAILFATTFYQPYMDVKLFGLFNVKLWHIAILFILIDLIQLPLENTGGHLSHIGGAIMGYLFVYFIKNGTDITQTVNQIVDFLANLFSSKKSTPFKKVHVSPKKPQTKKTSNIVIKDKTQKQIDEILDKISKSGYDSLTKEEKEFLFNAGK